MRWPTEVKQAPWGASTYRIGIELVRRLFVYPDPQPSAAAFPAPLAPFLQIGGWALIQA